MRGPLSWLVSVILGLVGALVGYVIFTRGLGIGDDDAFDLGGMLCAIIGVVIVLLVTTFVLNRVRRSRSRRNRSHARGLWPAHNALSAASLKDELVAEAMAGNPLDGADSMPKAELADALVSKMNV
jgi:uncharacterized membrane protein YeaQ/YmgE (transglycosylase-associated protein family)